MSLSVVARRRATRRAGLRSALFYDRRIGGASGDPGPPASPITSVRLLGPGDLDAVDVVNVSGTNYSPNPNGWVIETTWPIAGGFDGAIDCSKFKFPVFDPGFTTSKLAVSRYRTVKGGKRPLRFQQAITNPTYVEILHDSVTSGVRKVLMAIQHDTVKTVTMAGAFKAFGAAEIYQGTTFGQAYVEAGWVSGKSGGVVNVAVENRSTLAYSDLPPKVQCFSTYGEVQRGASRTVEFSALHQHGQEQQMVACVEIGATDGANQTEFVLVSTPVLSTTQTQGNIVECWRATFKVDGSGGGQALTHASGTTPTKCYDRAKVYPWIGDSAAVYDTAPYNGNVQDDRRSPYFHCDYNGTWAGGANPAKVIVRKGASNPTVTATSANPTLGSATVFGSMNTALSALKAYHNANFGHDSPDGGEVYVDSAGGDYAITITISNTPSTAAVDIKPHPSNVGVTALDCSTVRIVDSLLHWRDLTLTKPGTSTGNFITGGGTGSPTGEGKSLQMTNCIVDWTGTTSASQAFSGFHVRMFRNVTFRTTGGNPNIPITGIGHSTDSTVACATLLSLGTVVEDSMPVQQVLPYGLYGYIGRMNLIGKQSVTPSNDGACMYNVFWRKKTSTNDLVGSAINVVRGFFRVACVFEDIADGITTTMSGDGDTNAVANFNDMLNTVPPDPTIASDPTEAVDMGRDNFNYADVAAARGKQKGRSRSHGNLYARYASKPDTFDYNNAGPGRVGNWGAWWNVSHAYNVISFSRDPDYAADAILPNGRVNNQPSWAGPYRQEGSVYGAGLPPFVNNKAGPNGGGGGGNYHLASFWAAAQILTPEYMPLRLDWDGYARAYTAGVYEYHA